MIIYFNNLYFIGGFLTSLRRSVIKAKKHYGRAGKAFTLTAITPNATRAQIDKAADRTAAACRKYTRAIIRLRQSGMKKDDLRLRVR